jgi:lipoprotein-anchoring transpeptidase ErfK/SrfK
VPGDDGSSRQQPARPLTARLLTARPRFARRRWLVVAVLSTAGLLAAACSSGGTGHGTSGQAAGQHGAGAEAAGSVLSITPANGSANVKPGQGITVSASHGKITSVRVSAGNNPVGGQLSADGTVWHSRWALAVSQRYTVTARAVSATGHAVTTTSSFRTMTPSATFRTQIFEGAGKTYGVGMPIMLTFSHPITNRAAVERALQLRTSRPVVGAWYWQNSTTLNFRPRNYWPPHTTVSFTGHLNGVQGAPGVYGYHTLTQAFTIGRSLIVTASTKTHHMQLYRDGKLYRTWPISTGRPGDNTPNGTYVTIDKGNPVLMKGPGYRINVPWSVRFTWSGDYLHDAFWSVGEQGFTNVSHGCVNMPPAAAEAYYKLEVPGDPVTVTGSPRAGTWGNGWTDWFLPWRKYLQGSALHQAVMAGPHGSKFVEPSAVPASHASAPLEQPRPDNWTAS